MSARRPEHGRRGLGLAARGGSLVAGSLAVFPLGELLRQRGELASLSVQVSSDQVRERCAAHRGRGARTERRDRDARPRGVRARPSRGRSPWSRAPRRGRRRAHRTLRGEADPAGDLVADEPARSPRPAASRGRPPDPGFGSRLARSRSSGDHGSWLAAGRPGRPGGRLPEVEVARSPTGTDGVFPR